MTCGSGLVRGGWEEGTCSLSTSAPPARRLWFLNWTLPPTAGGASAPQSAWEVWFTSVILPLSLQVTRREHGSSGPAWMLSIIRILRLRQCGNLSPSPEHLRVFPMRANCFTRAEYIGLLTRQIGELGSTPARTTASPHTPSPPCPCPNPGPIRSWSLIKAS